MIHRGFFGLLGATFALLGHSAEMLDNATLEADINAYLHGVYSEYYSEAELANNVHLQPSNLDHRLQLAACTVPLAFALTAPQPRAANLTVKVSCEGAKRWSVYVPVKVDVYADVVVAGRNLARGMVLSASDLDIARVNIAHAGMGYYESLNQVVGMEMKRGVRAGMSLTASAVQAPTLIRRGETVVLEARVAGVAVVTSGEALSHGRLGEQIRVKNSRSARIVEATVTGAGKATIRL